MVLIHGPISSRPIARQREKGIPSNPKPHLLQTKSALVQVSSKFAGHPGNKCLLVSANNSPTRPHHEESRKYWLSVYFKVEFALLIISNVASTQ